MEASAELKAFYPCVGVVIACAYVTDHYPQLRMPALAIAGVAVAALVVSGFLRPKEKPQCPYCESMNVTTSIEHETLEYGLVSNRVLLDIDIPVQTCSDCKGMTTGEAASQIREAAINKMLSDRDLKVPAKKS